MANFIFNVSKGRIREFADRVNNNDPANSAFVAVLLASTGLESDSVLVDKDTLADVVSGATNEATNTGYTRLVLDNTSGITVTVDDANDRIDIDIPDLTFESVANDGTGAIGALLICYDSDTSGGSDANIIPISKHDFNVTPDGSDITAQIPSAGFARAA